ncbi:hypothetical protein MLD38_023420 [Melastoma candidum]|nr:hypothetical protein MLD38_023420 [Melastoma candidum]
MGLLRQQFQKRSDALKWLGLVTAVWVSSISGNNYSFSNYSDALKSIMGLTQLELNNLSVAKDVGKAFGLLAGLSSDRIPTWLILLIGSVEGILGYGAQWLVVSKRATLSYWQMCIFLCMGGNSSTWMNTATLVTCIRNFRKNRGPVSGILKGYVGLSTAIFTDLCTALFSDSASAMLLMLALIPFAVCMTSMVFLHEVPPSEEVREENRYFMVFNSLAVIVAFYLLAYDFSGSHGSIFNYAFAGILLLIMCSPLAIPVFDFFKGSRRASLDLESENNQEIQEPLLESSETVVGAAEQETQEGTTDTEGVETKRKPAIGDDHTIFEAMRTYEFWLLFVTFLAGVGTGLAVQNNMGQIGEALGYDDVSVFVSLISIWGFFGRIISGTGSEYLIK